MIFIFSSLDLQVPMVTCSGNQVKIKPPNVELTHKMYKVLTYVLNIHTLKLHCFKHIFQVNEGGEVRRIAASYARSRRSCLQIWRLGDKSRCAVSFWGRAWLQLNSCLLRTCLNYVHTYFIWC